MAKIQRRSYYYCEGFHNSLQYQWVWSVIECYKRFVLPHPSPIGRWMDRKGIRSDKWYQNSVKICALSSFTNWSLDGSVRHTVQQSCFISKPLINKQTNISLNMEAKSCNQHPQDVVPRIFFFKEAKLD